jgi:hypothetical protein
MFQVVSTVFTQKEEPPISLAYEAVCTIQRRAYLCPMPGVEPRFPGRLTHSLVTILTALEIVITRYFPAVYVVRDV